MRVYVLLLSAVAAIAAPRIETGTAADEETCRITLRSASVNAAHAQVFARFVVNRLKPSDRLVLEWIDPSGEALERTEYSEFPADRAVCVMSALQIAGFPAASRAGTWRVEARLNGDPIAHQTIELRTSGVAGARIEKAVAVRESEALRIDISGSGFTGGATVHVARFTSGGGWQYLAAAGPVEASGERLMARVQALAPGEYAVVIRAADGSVSPAARLLVPAAESYRFPAEERARWIITQRPYGSFSHWNRSRHAWDIAPAADRQVVAMRSGIARTFDLGLRRTPWKRSFGNYITIDHGDGEYSHYAHLQSGSFLVRSGQRVEQGQPIARAGNSGYALGPGGGVHLHVHVTRSSAIAAQSIPFEFGEPRQQARRTDSAPALSGAVAVAGWWSGMVSVPKRSAALRVRLEWDGETADLDLHLVSPSGRHYGWYGDRNGYSGGRGPSEEIRIAKPEPGRWRVSVQGVGGTPGATAFRVRLVDSNGSGSPNRTSTPLGGVGTQ